jgi:hypothetical protein
MWHVPIGKRQALSLKSQCALPSHTQPFAGAWLDQCLLWLKPEVLGAFG